MNLFVAFLIFTLIWIIIMYTLAAGSFEGKLSMLFFLMMAFALIAWGCKHLEIIEKEKDYIYALEKSGGGHWDQGEFIIHHKRESKDFGPAEF